MMLTIHGKPVAALVPIDNADLETVTLSTNPKFMALIERPRTRQRTEGGVTSDQYGDTPASRGLTYPICKMRFTVYHC